MARVQEEAMDKTQSVSDQDQPAGDQSASEPDQPLSVLEKPDAADESHDDGTEMDDAETDDDGGSSSSSIHEGHGETRDSIDHGEPDINHEEVEAVTSGHALDIELGRIRSTKALSRIESHGSIKFKLSRALSNASRGDRRNIPFSDMVPVGDLDKGIVGWDSPDDPAMPFNMPPSRKWVHVGVLAAATFLTTFASSILSPGIASLNEEFDNSNSTVGSMTVSVYLLGYVIGPLFMAPLSEIYGRKPVLSTAGAFFCCWQLACALAPNMPGLIVFRFFGGVGGAGSMTLGGSVVGDLFRTDQRGLAMGIWNLGPLVGPTIGPLLGGFLTETIGWRWDFWIVLIAGVLVSLALHILGPETNPRVLIQYKMARLRKELGRDDLRSCYATPGSSASQSKIHILLNGLVRPTKMLFLSPMIFSLSLYMAYVYGVMYLLLTTIPDVFEQTYGFSVGYTGFVYLSLGFSNIVGWLVITVYSDKSVIQLAKANNGHFEPEMRLAISVLFGTLLPITFFWYGWTAQYKVQWMSPIVSLMPFGFGMMGLFIPITTYLVDSYAMYAASALAANVVLRSLVGALLPLAGPSLYANLGYGWGNSVLGFISIGMIPVPMLIYKYGDRLRKAQRFKL